MIEGVELESLDDKTLLPYIERFNGNIRVKQGNFVLAIEHYNKALLNLQTIFEKYEDSMDRQQAMLLVLEVEGPCRLNLAHCFNKTGKYFHAVKYCQKVLENDPTNCKALYRRGNAYTSLGEVKRAKDDF